MDKVVSKEAFKSEIKPRLQAEGKTIALCHGVFDLVHPGHIIHLEQAKAMAAVSDGAIVGSAIVDIIARHGEGAAPELYRYVKAMKQAVAEA